MPFVLVMTTIFIDYLSFLCCSEFQDIFDVDHFIKSLRDEVRILKELPTRLKLKVERGFLYSMPPISWSDISYYKNQVSFLVSTGQLFQELMLYLKGQSTSLPLYLSHYVP